MSQRAAVAPERIDRYLVFGAFARGGTATLHFARVEKQLGFSRVVALKRLHPHLTREPEAASMLIDEARLAGRIQHPNVVAVEDVVVTSRELCLVMDYVPGLSLAELLSASRERSARVPTAVACAVAVGMLHGLHAAHEARDSNGELLRIVHRDVSPQNVLVGCDGVVRVTDFGIAHARERLQVTRTDELKGKFGYMAREQVERTRVDARTDVYAASVVLWEMLTGRQLFGGGDPKTVLARVALGEVPTPKKWVPTMSAGLERVVMQGLSASPKARFASAREMAAAIEQATSIGSQLEVAKWVEHIGGATLHTRASNVASIEAWPERAPAELPRVPMLPSFVPPPTQPLSSVRVVTALAVSALSRWNLPTWSGYALLASFPLFVALMTLLSMLALSVEPHTPVAVAPASTSTAAAVASSICTPEPAVVPMPSVTWGAPTVRAQNVIPYSDVSRYQSLAHTLRTKIAWGHGDPLDQKLLETVCKRLPDPKCAVPRERRRSISLRRD